jgi:sec-independent protein translocase protein TatB|tara:strand:- start:907 stop:1146 length:240 start_codon:yes stop_codon:yes gene_type:complete
MPQIGWFEILLVLAIAIIVIGPKDFPFMLKKIGSWIGTVKRYIYDVQREVSEFDNDNIITDVIPDIKKDITTKKNNDKK